MSSIKGHENSHSPALLLYLNKSPKTPKEVTNQNGLQNRNLKINPNNN